MLQRKFALFLFCSVLYTTVTLIVILSVLVGISLCIGCCCGIYVYNLSKSSEYEVDSFSGKKNNFSDRMSAAANDAPRRATIAFKKFLDGIQSPAKTGNDEKKKQVEMVANEVPIGTQITLSNDKLHTDGSPNENYKGNIRGSLAEGNTDDAIALPGSQYGSSNRRSTDGNTMYTAEEEDDMKQEEYVTPGGPDMDDMDLKESDEDGSDDNNDNMNNVNNIQINISEDVSNNNNGYNSATSPNSINNSINSNNNPNYFNPNANNSYLNKKQLGGLPPAMNSVPSVSHSYHHDKPLPPSPHRGGNGNGNGNSNSNSNVNNGNGINNKSNSSNSSSMVPLSPPKMSKEQSEEADARLAFQLSQAEIYNAIQQQARISGKLAKKQSQPL